MTRQLVEWLDNGWTSCGRFALYSEHPRGERRWYKLEVNDVELARLYVEHGFDGSFEKRTVMRQAQRLVDLAAKAAS